MKPQKQKQLEPIEEAYKMLDGQPEADGVSKAAKGEDPETDDADRDDYQDNKYARLMEGCSPEDIDEAYHNLFEALAVITRKR